MRRYVSIAALALTLLAAQAPAASAAPQDDGYLSAAHQANLTEIALGDLAETYGESPLVRNLGTMFAHDHAKLDDALKPVAQQLGVALPDQPSAQQQTALRELAALGPGARFDHQWITTQLAGHTASAAATQTELDKGTDPAVKALAETAAPVVAGHLQGLREAAPQLGVPLE